MDEWRPDTLRAEEVTRWAEFLGRENGMESSYFLRHYENDPDRCLDSVFVIRDGEKIVSSVRVFHRACYLDGQILPVGAIGEVCTDSAYRCRGLSRMLLSEAMRYLERAGFPLAELRTRVDLQPHYALHGFRQVIKPRLTVTKPEKAHAEVRRLTPEDFSEMARLYETYAPSYRMMAVRSRSYWESWCRAELSNPTGLFREGRLVGYVCYADNNVRELIASEKDHDILLGAVETEQTELDVPGLTVTHQEIKKAYSLLYTMVRVNRPIRVWGREFTDTEAFAESLNQRGGTHALHADWY